MFQKQQLDTRTVDGFEESDVGVKQINSNDNSIAAQLISKEPEDIQQATFCIYNATFTECKKVEDVLEVGETEVLEFSQFERSDSTAEYNANVSYMIRVIDSVYRTRQN